jgi:DNA-binding winged helix-turn-helix (wHTH) protein/tetratricopeptide (TPR) repeat protein
MMEVLLCLAEKRGEVVSKEQLIRTVWANTFVTDDVLTRCISELRRALHDDPKNPKVIQTIHKKGYRLVAPVSSIEPESLLIVSLPPQVPSASAPPISAKHHSSRRWTVLLGAVILFAVGVALTANFFRHRAPLLNSKDPIIVAEFVNASGDPVFDGTLRQGLAAQLGQSPYLNILSDEQIVATLHLMGEPSGTKLTSELARQVCQRTGGSAMLSGSVAQIGGQYELVLNAINCSNGARLASAEAIAGDRNHILDALDRVSTQLRSQLGESLASIQKFNAPLEEVTTPSLDALQAYTLGWRAHLSGDEWTASPSFERAISLDPNFAMAYAALGSSYGSEGESARAVSYLQKAYDRREQLSERERFYVSSHYEMNATGDLEKANQIFRMWAQRYPQDVVPVEDMGWNYLGLGYYDRSLAAGRRVLALAPDFDLPYELLGYSYLGLNRFDEQAAILRQSKSHGIDSPIIHVLTYDLGFLRRDLAQMERELVWAQGKPGVEDVLFDFQSDAQSFSGHVAQADDWSARAVASARRSGAHERAASYLAEQALRDALNHDFHRARIEAAAALRAEVVPETQVEGALAFALSGDSREAQKIAGDLAQQYPLDTITQFNYLPTIRAAIALDQKRPANALASVHAAAPYELGTVGVMFGMCPAYVRGLAYLAARRGPEARAEFQKILDHPGVALNAPGNIRPLAHLQIAKAYAIEGEFAKAREAYRDFFELWKDADPAIPILKQAESEYSKLREP